MNYYIFYFEQKDVACLSDVSRQLKSQGQNVFDVILDKFDRDIFRRWSTDSCPVSICSSLASFYLADYMRTGRSYVSVGLEHGVAPFKSYTFNNHFLNYDYYISPTELWRKRLCDLYPEGREKFLEPAYPRLDDLRAIYTGAGRATHPLWVGVPEDQRKLVVFSWGVSVEALKAMPDVPGVVYLVHPSMKGLIKSVELKHAKLMASMPYDAALLVNSAGSIYGDFSSMTMEAAVLNPRTYMFIERAFYSQDCDLKPEFFDRTNPGFGQIEHLEARLPSDGVLNQEGLFAALNSSVDLPAAMRLVSWMDAGLLPAAEADHTLRTAEALLRIAAPFEGTGSDYQEPTRELAALCAVDEVYHQVLGHGPQKGHMVRMAKSLLDNGSSYQKNIVGFIAKLIKTEAGMERLSKGLI